jgi:ribosome-binding factor A
MRSFSRSERVSGLVRKVLSEFLQKAVSDPRLAQATITGVKMSPDLKIAKIFFVTYGSTTDSEETKAGFMSARGYLKRHLAGKLGLRYMPEFQFYYDESLDYGTKIDNLIKTALKNHESDHSPIKE